MANTKKISKILDENSINFSKHPAISEEIFFNDNKKVSFSEKTTENKLSQKSFVQNFLSSIRAKMYGKR